MKSVLYKFEAKMPSGHSAEDFTVGVKTCYLGSQGRGLILRVSGTRNASQRHKSG